jgi:hypothetical protein
MRMKCARAAACRFYNLIEDVRTIYQSPLPGIAPVRPTSDRHDTQQFTPSLCRTDIEISIESKIEGAGFTLLRTNCEESKMPSQIYESWVSA